MKDLTATAYVILGFVRKGPKSGYEIKALVDNSTRFFWAASYGQIYPELKRLSKAGLITGLDSPTGGRKRTVYKITADGEEELRSWLRQRPETFEMRDEGLLKLFFADALPRQEALQILREMRARRLAVHEQLQAIKDSKLKGEVEDPFPLIVLEGGLEFSRWFADWCGRMEAQLLDSAPDEKRSS